MATKLWLLPYKWRVQRAVKGYPLYDPPHKSSENAMSEAMALENFAYFMRVRHERLAILRAWMQRHFFFYLRFEPECAYQLESWMKRYSPFLIDDRINSYDIFGKYQPTWVGNYSGYNLLFDIGIYVGEYVIAKRPHIHWDMDREDASEPATQRYIGFQRPALHGFAQGVGTDPLGIAWRYAKDLRQYTDDGSGRRLVTDNIINSLKCDLYLATRNADDTSLIRNFRNDKLE